MAPTKQMKDLCTFVTGIALSTAVIAKGPPPDLVISLDGPDTSRILFDSPTMAEPLGTTELGTILLSQDEVVNFHIIWNYPMQSVWASSQDSSWDCNGVYYFSRGPIGEFSISLWGLEWGYDVTMVLALPDSELHPVRVIPYVQLGGSFRDDDPYGIGTELCNNGLLPLTEPYSALGWMPVGSGGETALREVLNPQTEGYYNVVDWVLLELRDALDPTITVASKCGLLHAYGIVTAEDGVSPVTFMAPYGNYYLAVRHRNHLGAMTAYPFNAMSLPTYIFMASPEQVMNGETALVQSSSLYRFGLCPGNVRPTAGHQQIKYIGTNDDRDPILQLVGASTPAGMAFGYYNEDTNLDGIVKYVGADNDRDIVLQAIGGTIPTAVRMEQLPW
jgi:hypothetical protein